MARTWLRFNMGKCRFPVVPRNGYLGGFHNQLQNLSSKFIWICGSWWYFWPITWRSPSFSQGISPLHFECFSCYLLRYGRWWNSGCSRARKGLDLDRSLWWSYAKQKKGLNFISVEFLAALSFSILIYIWTHWMKFHSVLD